MRKIAIVLLLAVCIAAAKTQNVAEYPGNDLGQKIIACLADRPLNGGVACDASYIEGTQNFINNTIDLPDFSTVIFGQASVTSSVLPVFRAGFYVNLKSVGITEIHGPGGPGSMIVALGNYAPGVTITDIWLSGTTNGQADGSVGFDLSRAAQWKLIRTRATHLDIPYRQGGTSICACYITLYDPVFHGVTASLLLEGNSNHNQFYNAQTGPGVKGIVLTGGQLVYSGGSWQKAGDDYPPADNLFTAHDLERGFEGTTYAIDLEGSNNTFFVPYLEGVTDIKIRAGSKGNSFLGRDIKQPDMSELTYEEIASTYWCDGTNCHPQTRPVPISKMPPCNPGWEGTYIPVTNARVNKIGAVIYFYPPGEYHVWAYCDGENWIVAAARQP